MAGAIAVALFICAAVYLSLWAAAVIVSARAQRDTGHPFPHRDTGPYADTPCNGGVIECGEAVVDRLGALAAARRSEIEQYKGWAPYCLKCRSMARMISLPYGWQCGSCHNQIGHDLYPLVKGVQP